MNHRLPTLLAVGSIFLFGATAMAQPSAQNSKQESAEPPPAEPKAPAPDAKKEVPSTGRWQMSFYGFVEFDGMYDSTQSFSDSPGNTPILRSDGSRPAYLPVGTDELKGVMYGAYHGRLQATARNTRFGFK